MAQSLKSIKSRIRGITSTKKLTRAMEMISISKLKRAENMLDKSRPYFLKINSFLNNILSNDIKAVHPLLEDRPDKQSVALCLVTSDTGLCGSYNHALLHTVEQFLSSYNPDNVRLIALGKKGFSYFNKKGFNIPYSYIGLNGRYSAETAEKIAKVLQGIFLSKEVEEVYIAYTLIGVNHKASPVLEKLFNIGCKNEQSVDYIYEPSIARILEELLPVYVLSKIRIALLNAFTAEHKARAVAMGESTKNARELLEGLVLLRNKIRQSNITKEIIEVISSSEALKG